MVKSLRLAWISKFLSDTNDSWKAIPNYYFSDYGGLQFVLKCNYNVNLINKNIPIFYRELLHYFCEIKNISNIFPHGEFLLWNNEAITIENNMLFWKSWFNQKVLFWRGLSLAWSEDVLFVAPAIFEFCESCLALLFLFNG